MPASIYLDNAATSFPKPECVYDAVDRYQRTNGRPVGRGTSDAALDVLRSVDRCRMRAAQLLGAASKQQIVFTFNATDALNTVLHGFLKPGDHVVTTVVEHNSVLRPLRHLEQRGVQISIVGCDEHGLVQSDDVKAALRPNTKLIALQHVSNVTGVIQPVEDVAEIARMRDIRLLLDTAQSAGHLPLNLSEISVDFVACSGHKGLLGPLGTGLLIIAPGRETELEPLRLGGTGSRSESDIQPDVLPDRFESGNHNAPGLIGLDAALGFLQETTIERVRAHELALSQQLVDGLRSITALQIFSLEDRVRHTGIVSLTSELYSSDELALLLSQHFGIDTRAGLHCAPGIHRRMGTLTKQGTVRLSVGLHNTTDEIDAVLSALKELHGTT